jgi:hypothetical protein
MGGKTKVKCKIIPVPKQHAMKTYGEIKVKFHKFLNSALDGSE